MALKLNLTQHVKTSFIGLFVAALLAAVQPLQAQDAPQMNLQRLKLLAGMHQIDVQVASNSEQRQIEF